MFAGIVALLTALPAYAGLGDGHASTPGSRRLAVTGSAGANRSFKKSLLGTGHSSSRSILLSSSALRSGSFAGSLLGAYVNPDNSWNGVQSDEQKVLDFEAKVGRPLAIDMRYHQWTSAWPFDIDRWDVASGRTPMISWGSPGSGPTLDQINSGSQDAWIRERARAALGLGEFFLRPLWEMNGNWSAWDGTHNGRDPSQYVAAWRRIHSLFRAEGATNAIFVWSPNASDNPGELWNHWTNYYPGDAYVDWVGIDGYNWGSTQSWSSWTRLLNIVQPLYSDYAARKPIMVAETASAEAGGVKADWIAQAHSDLVTALPRVKAFVWFDSAKETDWRVDSSDSSLSAYRALALDPYFTTTLKP